MNENVQEIEYLNLLKRIIISNSKSEYSLITNAYKRGNYSLDDAYQALLQESGNDLKNAMSDISSDRTGTGTYKSFGEIMRFDMADGFPLITTKETSSRLIIEELLWFIKGDTNIKPLVMKGVNIWNEDAFRNYLEKTGLIKDVPRQSQAWNEQLSIFISKIKSDDDFAALWGELGPIYGAQWRNYGGHDKFKVDVENLCQTNKIFNLIFNCLVKKYNLRWNGAKGIDQLNNSIKMLKTNPNDRRNLIYAFNPSELDQQALPPCHTDFQFDVKNDKLSLLMHIRSNDLFLGAPFNMASYAALLHMVAQVTDLEPGSLIYTAGNAHIYANHIDQVQEQLSRKPFAAPTIELDRNIKNIEDFDINSIKIKNYQSHPKIKGKMST